MFSPREGIEAIDVDFEMDPARQASLDFWLDILRNSKQYQYDTVETAKEAVADLHEELGAPTKEYDDLTTLRKVFWLMCHPQHCANTRMLKQEYEKLKSDNRDEERRSGPEFDNLQFRVVEDMTVLREVRNYLLKRVGAITEHHVSFWRTHRMYDNDTPLSAYARLKEEANTLAEFNPTFCEDVEIWKLITRAYHPGVNFFPKHLFDAVDLTMHTKKHDYYSNDPDYYIQISDLWPS
jgi:hypothetical protein